MVGGHERKPSWYQRYESKRAGRDVSISDDQMKTTIGMDKEQLLLWSKARPGVGENQVSRWAMGQTAGFNGGYAGLLACIRFVFISHKARLFVFCNWMS